MATAMAKTATGGESREYPTEWAIYSSDEPDQRTGRGEGGRALEGRKPVGRESRAAAEGQVAVALG